MTTFNLEKTHSSFKSVPEGTTKVRCLFNPKIKTLDTLPASVTDLEIRNCHGIRDLTTLPQTVRHLRCPFNPQLTSLEGLPEKLETLVFHDCPNIKSWKGVPAGLEGVHCGNTGITSFEGLPHSVTKLRVTGLAWITDLACIPRQIQELMVDHAPNLRSTKGCPQGLTILNCAYSGKLTELADLPSTLTHTDFSGCEVHNFSQVPGTSLTVVGATAAELTTIPPSIRVLDVSVGEYSDLGALSGLALSALDCSSTPDLTSLQGLPQTLQELDCGYCPITDFSPVPRTLRTLKFDGVAPLPNVLKLKLVRNIVGRFDSGFMEQSLFRAKLALIARGHKIAAVLSR